MGGLVFSHSGGGSRRVVPSLFCFSEAAIHVAAPCCDRSVEECAAGGNVYICEHKESGGVGGEDNNQQRRGSETIIYYLVRVNVFR